MFVDEASKVEVRSALPITQTLVVGGNGLIGSAVKQVLDSCQTSCRLSVSVTSRMGKGHFLDLENIHEDELVDADLVFLCAGVSGFKECEGNVNSWRINVDGVLRVALAYPFCVYVSTDSVEWSGSNYSRQRAQVEAVLLARGNAVIMRCGRVTKDTALQCASALVERGLRRNPGVYHWP